MERKSKEPTKKSLKLNVWNERKSKEPTKVKRKSKELSKIKENRKNQQKKSPQTQNLKQQKIERTKRQILKLKIWDERKLKEQT